MLSGARFFYAPGRPPPPAGIDDDFKPWGMNADLSARSRRLAEQLAQIAGLLGPRVFPLPGASIDSAPAPALILELGSVAETSLAGGGLDPSAAAESWSPFLIQLWEEIRK